MPTRLGAVAGTEADGVIPTPRMLGMTRKLSWSFKSFIGCKSNPRVHRWRFAKLVK
jgi:hypothetical protein